MPKLTINGTEITVEPGTSILQACEQVGVEVPRFCYHDRLSVPANCRMCLVQVKGAPKPVASCAMPCADNMAVETETDVVKKARHGVMEFLLINHPLDCPICDQGGECDLQDQAVAYGFDRSRYNEDKRAVKDKELGPLVKTVMTRCIHCTRCVRFGEEIAGTEELGVLNRGEHLEIGTYVEQMMTSELSGNLVDVCPVGALTSKPYAFKARPWELKKTQTIDVMDAVGSNIRMDARGNEVLRVLPRLHEGVNEEWISDKTRHAIDGLKYRRLDRPWVRKGKALEEATWDEAFDAIAKRLKSADGKSIAAIAGDTCDVESMLALKDLMGALGSANIDCRQDGATFDASTRAGYLFNTTIAGLENADVIVLVGTNPRHEAAMINARIRKAWLHRRAKVAVIGPKVDLNYPYEHLGAGPQTLEELIEGKHSFAEKLKGAKNAAVIVGSGALARQDGVAVQAAARELAEKYNMVREGWNGFNVLHRAASRVGGLDIGFVPGKGGKSTQEILSSGDIDVLYLLGADELDLSKLNKKSFVIYQGHHGDAGAARADVILPGAAWSEKHGIYVNTEGRVQLGRKAVFPPGEAREDWTILRALSEKLGQKLPYDSLGQLRRSLEQRFALFSSVDTIAPAKWESFGGKDKLSKEPFALPVSNFYMTDPISRASKVMAQCTETFVNASAERTGSHG